MMHTTPPDLSGINALRSQLARNGYHPIAVKTADKVPAGFAWQKAVGAPPLANLQSLNTGLLCAGLRVVDIDIDDPETAESVFATALDLLGSGPVRMRSNSARRLIVYRAETGQPAKRTLVSKSLRNDEGKPAKIEVLGAGQQFVAYGTHPSGVDFEWSDPDLRTLPCSDLPAVSEDDIGTFLDACRAALQLGPEQAPVPVRTPAPAAPMRDAGDDEIAELLDFLHPDCAYDEWLAALMAVHAATGGSGSGLAIADAWSSRGTKYKGRKELEAKWRSFKRTGITIATLAELARRSGADLSAIAIRHGRGGGYGDAEHGAELARTLLASVNGVLHDAETGEIVEAAPMARAPDIAFPRGLVGRLAQWILDTSRSPQPALSLGAALAIVSVATGRHIAGPTSAGTALYILGLSPTGSGKDHPLKQITRVLTAARMAHHIGPPEFISMTAIVNALKRKPLSLCPMDEFGDFMRRVYSRKGSPHERALPKILRTMWSANFDAASTPEWAGIQSETITAPHLSIFGVSTHEQFYSALEGGAASDGTLNRFLIIEGDKRIIDRTPALDPYAVPQDIVRDLHAIFNRSGELSAAMRNDAALDMAGAAKLLVLPWCPDGSEPTWTAFRNRCRVEMGTTPANADFWVRGAEMAVRIATIVAAGRHGVSIERQDIDFGIALAERSIALMIAGASDYMAENENEANIQRILRMVKDGGVMSRSTLMRAIRNMRARDFNDALSYLCEAELIERLEIHPPGNKGGRPSISYRIAN